MQDDRDGHETPSRLPPPDTGLGVGWMLQVRPFHRSARVSGVPRRLLVFPTAVQADGAVQATPLRVLGAAPGGLGAAWTVHLEPFHRSATATRA